MIKNKQRIKNTRIYLSPPHLSNEGYELEFVKAAFASNWIAPVGPDVNAFEKDFAEWNDISHAAALSSGTAAIHLALRILGIDRGDEVFCSSFTFAASATPILYQKAIPVFIDSELKTWNIDPNLLEDSFKKRSKSGKMPKALISVDICGQTADYNEILPLCQKYNVPLIEDAAEALGAFYNGRKAGRFGLMSAFSFNGNKIITTSGGGMLVSENEAYIKKARFLSQQARDPVIHYQHTELGYNYRMSNIVAAIGRGQLKILADRIERKRNIIKVYQKYLSGVPGIEFMPEPEGYYSTNWLTTLLIISEKFGASRDQVQSCLETYNIESRPLWMPMHMQPLFSGSEIFGGSVCEGLFNFGLSLPCGTALTDGDIKDICQIILEVPENKFI